VQVLSLLMSVESQGHEVSLDQGSGCGL
jgi:hypothetical protein